jgi:hypothetical protein
MGVFCELAFIYGSHQGDQSTEVMTIGELME